jgi:hypothetical protein
MRGGICIILSLSLLLVAAAARANPDDALLLPMAARAYAKGTAVVDLDLVPSFTDSACVAAGSLVALPRGTKTVAAAALEVTGPRGTVTIPAEMVHVGEPMILRGVPVVPVSLDAQAAAAFAGGPLASARITLAASGAPLGSGVEASGPPRNRGCYLIVTADEFADALAPLIAWKTQAGFDVQVRRISETGPSKDEIRNYVQNAYRTWTDPPRYLLLVGDVETVPTWRVSGNVSDHHYACVDGDDFVPDLFVGRMSAKTPADVEVQVAKTVRYESAPDTTGGDPWFSRALLVAGNLNSSTPVPLGRWAGQKLLAAGFSATDSVYKSNSPQHPWWDGKIPIKYFVDRGVSMVNYRGWAYGDAGWQPPNFWNEHVPTLANGWKLPVVFSIVCHTNNFGNAEIDCFGEVWLKAGTPETPKGAVAFIGTGEDHSHSRWNDRIDIGVIQAVTDKDLREVGAILVSAKLGLVPEFPGEVYMNEVHDPEQAAEYYCNIYNLLGDPSLEMRTAPPRPLSIHAPRSTGFGANAVDIGVTESDGVTPVAGARVALSQDGHLIGYGVSDATGTARASLAAVSSDRLTVTVTGRDLYPAQTTVEVTQAEASLTAMTAEPAVLPGGARDVTLRVGNTGTSATAAATIAVESAADGVTVLDGAATLGGLAIGATGVTSPVRLQLAAGIEDGARLRLRVIPTLSGAGTLPASDVYLTVAAPALTCAGTAGGDGVFDPGETSDLILSLRNDGSAGGGAIAARLRARVPGKLTVVDSTAAWSEILPGASGANDADPLRVRISDTTAVGSVIPLALYVQHAGGPAAVVLFNLVVGAVDASAPTGPDAHGYYAYDNADVDYPGQAPAFRWMECSPLYGGAGTRLAIDDNLHGVLLKLPFTFNYYGVPYDSIRVSDNGWIAFDTEWVYDIRNWRLPDNWGPASQVCPFWDNLDPSVAGSDGFYAWYDAVNHQQVIEWSRLRNYGSTGEESSGCDDFHTFELALRDPAYYPTPTGDGEILFQYKQIVNDDWTGMYATVGMEDPTESVALLYSYGNQYQPGAAPLSPGLAIRITTVPPVYRPVAAGPIASGPMVRLLGCSVNGGETRLLLDAGRRAVDELAVFDASGRRVRDLAGDLTGGGPRTILWDGRDQSGRRVPSGLYWVRVRAGGESPRVRVLVVR